MVTLRSILVFSLTFCFVCCAQKTKLTIQFDRVDNLQVGGKVYHKGLEIGEVTRLGLFGTRILADIEVHDTMKIPVGSTFMIVPNLLGPSSIMVDYSDKQQFLSSSDTVTGHYQDKRILDHLVSDSAKRERLQQSLDKIGEGISELAEAARDSGKIDIRTIKGQK